MPLHAWSSRQWLLAMAGLCIAGVAAALLGQYGFDMRPCPWCILQRIIFVVIAVLCLLGALLPPAGVRKPAALAAVLLALLGGSAALYQHFVAARSVSCNLTLADRIITALKLEELMPSLFGVTGSCAEGAVSLLGVPFEFWSLALFVLLVAIAVTALTRRA
jgi:disulfide bond formation protein DsbB